MDALEREAHERAARANAALAAAQDRAYWLDRWNLDLNALMRRRGASELRAGLRAARGGLPRGSTTRATPGALPLKLREARRSVEEERAHAEAATAGPLCAQRSRPTR